MTFENCLAPDGVPRWAKAAGVDIRELASGVASRVSVKSMLSSEPELQ